MELENIVANTVYLKAREGGPEGSKGRSKKWKKLLTFPHISECLDTETRAPLTPLKADTYDYIVAEQPIGNQLFRQFCQKNCKQYTHFNDFLDEVENYETELEENRNVEALKIFKKYLSKPEGKFSFQSLKVIHPRSENFWEEEERRSLNVGLVRATAWTGSHL